MSVGVCTEEKKIASPDQKQDDIGSHIEETKLSSRISNCIQPAVALLSLQLVVSQKVYF